MTSPKTDEDLAAYCEIEEQVRVDTDAYVIWNDLKEAEKALLLWGHEAVKTCKEYKGYQGLLEEMFLKVDRFPVQRQKLIRLLMKIDNSSVKAQGKAKRVA